VTNFAAYDHEKTKEENMVQRLKQSESEDEVE
jgi:hypothetical protein